MVCQTEWGTYKLTAAVKVMLRLALDDPHAQQFLLLSDTGVVCYVSYTLELNC